jgi:hypothetical protein
VENNEVITDNSDLCDVILVLSYINLPKFRWKVGEKSGFVMPLNVTTDLDQANMVPNNNGHFLDLVVTNARGGCLFCLR